jgi:hypothetical protein
MNELTAQDACTAVKAAILKLEAAIKASQKLGTFKAKHQVDMLLRPLQVGVNNQTSIQQGSSCSSMQLGFLFRFMPAGVGGSPLASWLHSNALPSLPHDVL